MKATFSISENISLEPSGFWDSDPRARLEWLAQRLEALGLCQNHTFTLRRGQPSLEVTVFAQGYRLLVASTKTVKNKAANKTPANDRAVLSLIRRSQIIDRLLGREIFDANDAFARVLQDILEREAAGAQTELNVLWR